MLKKAIIFDLDNTIYSVQSLGITLFKSLFKLIRAEGSHLTEIDTIETELMRRPFQLVAKEYAFSDELTAKANDLLQDLTFDGPMHPFPDYHITKELDIDKFLVTTGYPKLQRSKIKALDIEQDFKEIHIVDPSQSTKTKKDVFADIMQRHNYVPDELLVVGDDPDSEIKAAIDLGIDALLYGKGESNSNDSARTIRSMEQLQDFLH